MLKEIILPEVSDNVETGDVLKILVKVGDKVEIDQPLVELETDKSTFELPSTESGIVKEINVKQGDVVRIGAVLMKVETNGEGDAAEQAPIKSEKISSDIISENKKTQDAIAESKLPELPGEATMVRSEDKVEYNTGVQSAPASPSVRRLARELGVDINLVSGSGDGGRISEDDVKKFVKENLNKTADAETTSNRIYQKALPDFSKWGEVDVQPMTKVREITASSMSYAWSTIPMVTQFDKADITHLEEFRKKNLKKIEASGGHLTITSILVKICEAALKKFPQFNSSIDLQRKKIIYKKYFNIGIAVDTDRGLLVPVIKNVERKNLIEISSELNNLSEKARNKKITPDEMEGGNFTISNLGGIGGTNFTPIVYSPQVAILGVSRGNTEPIYRNEKIETALMLPLALTYDHRIIDGADAARFLRWICDVLENPVNLFL